MREMKDSGVKWVGEIPSSWKVYKVKQIADSNNDVLPENYEEEQEIDYIEIGSVTYEHGVRTTEKMKFGNAPSRARRIVHNGDTIISTVRTYLKAIACRLFDKDIHRFSIYSKFLYTMLPKGHGGEKINIDDKVLLEYYKLEKDFEGPIELESTEGGYTPISGDSGHREPKKDPLTVIIDKINEKYGTHFTEMDKVLVQMENDYANQEKWQSYAKNNDRATFMLLFEKDFPNMAADRYEQNDQFFRKLFDDPDMMKQVMETVGSVLYERLKKKYIFDPKSGVIEEATPETYVEDTYLTKK